MAGSNRGIDRPVADLAVADLAVVDVDEDRGIDLAGSSWLWVVSRSWMGVGVRLRGSLEAGFTVYGRWPSSFGSRVDAERLR